MQGERERPIHGSGVCEIDLARRELRILGSPVRLGGHAFEMIELLVQSGGRLVTKDELMRRIWPGAVVMENTLQVHAAAVRKALGPYRHLLRTESRRGYRLLGEWTLRQEDAAKPSTDLRRTWTNVEGPATNIPPTVTPLVGRSAAIRKLQALVSAYRIVTLTGPGGIGKTALALEAARQVLGTFADGVWLVELSSLSDHDLVPSAVAGVLGLRLGSSTISPEAVARAVIGKRLLLILDNCEHVIDAAAKMSEALVRLCPHLTVMTTSREVLRVEGEHAYRVAPLEVPATEQLDPAEILAHSAPQLFIARAKELAADFSPDARSLRTVAEICRQLDGTPLAIEFAAARASTLGIQQVAAGLRDRFAVLTDGRRTALPRHRTLRATLDWSYDLLVAPERLLLQRLAVFSGSFPLAAALAVVGGGPVSETEIANSLANLVAKSLVVSDSGGGTAHFRLLETTRMYALSKLIEGGDLQSVSRRHALYYQSLLRTIENEWEKSSIPLAHVDNVRSALEWCFSANGDRAIGVRLAAAATPVFLAMSLLAECQRWSERGILALDEAARGGVQEMNLQTSFGISSMQMRGESDAARAALSRSHAIAEAQGDVLNQVGLLGMLSMFEVRDGDFKASLHYARLSRAVSGIEKNSTAMALANSILGRALQFVGEHDGSRGKLESSFQYWSTSQHTREVYLGLDHYALVGIGLARNLWFQGLPAQAIDRVCQTINNAERKKHPASLGLALSWAPGMFVWVGDYSSANEYTEWLLSHAEMHALRPYLAVALGYQGMLAVGRGEARNGIEKLRECLEQFRAMRYQMLKSDFELALAKGLVAIGECAEALALVDETIRLIGARGDLLHMPEALRIKGNVLLSNSQHRTDEAEACFRQSLGWSRRQGAQSWTLRAGVDLAALWAVKGQWDRAWALLHPIVERFTEGLDTADLKAARQLLGTLR